MNLQYQHISKKTRRITAELVEMLADMNEALKINHKHSVKMDKARTRVKQALLHLQDVPE